MFETREEIRKAARTKFIAEQVEKAERRGRKEGIKEGREEGLKEGAQQAMVQFKANLREQGIKLSPEEEQRLLKEFGSRKWWQHLPPFRKR